MSSPSGSRIDRDNALSVSYLPILPPLWAELPTDDKLYPRPVPLSSIPTQIPLSELSSCIHSSTQRPIGSGEVTLKACRVYGLCSGGESTIEVYPCSDCPSARFNAKVGHWIGPETRALGLFNYNNSILFTHDLLDEYTSAFTTSETPFVSWTAVVARRYNIHGSTFPFVSDDTFRTVWFAYTRLQQLERDMTCPSCGPSPEDVIWDGISLGFQKKFVSSSLRPPTILHKDSIKRDKARYIPQQQALVNPDLRRGLRQILRGPHSPSEEILEDDSLLEDTVEGTPEYLAQVKAATRSAATLDYIGVMDKVEKDMVEVCPDLAKLYHEQIGVGIYVHSKRRMNIYVELFAHVRLYLRSSCGLALTFSADWG